MQVKISRLIMEHDGTKTVIADWLSRDDKAIVAGLKSSAQAYLGIDKPRINYRDLRCSHNGVTIRVETKYI